MSVPSASPGPAVAPEVTGRRPLLSIVVPVYNGGEEIVGNVTEIQRAVTQGLGEEEIEVIVVSDGSIDDTAERLLAARTDARIRVIHYDRNLGKGYAVKAGALASHGEWVSLVDADLDLDPASIPEYLDAAQLQGLDIAVGSKRHQDSVVSYPRVRRAASWCYQQLNRFLFGLNVRDTQVGLKVFSRPVVDEVFPLLLVKQFAFDLELLAVATALGFGRIRELPVRLDYRFTGSQLRPRSVARALLDTAAIFYRLRILRTYQRKRRLLGPASVHPDTLPLVTLAGNSSAAATLDYPRLEVASSIDRADALRGARGELIAVLAPNARAAGNWVTAAVPYFADSSVAAVVVPTLAPLRGSLRERVAAAVLESRLGGGSRRLLYLPGNVRTVSDHEAESIVIRRSDRLAALTAGVDDERLVAWLAARGKRTVYTPDTSVSVPPQPILMPHLRGTVRYARARGAVARRTGGTSLSAATARSLAPVVAGIVGVGLVLAGGTLRTYGLVLIAIYAAALVLSGIHAGLRFRSIAVSLLQPPVVVMSQFAYVAGFLRGLFERTRSTMATS